MMSSYNTAQRFKQIPHSNDCSCRSKALFIGFMSEKDEYMNKSYAHIFSYSLLTLITAFSLTHHSRTFASVKKFNFFNS